VKAYAQVNRNIDAFLALKIEGVVRRRAGLARVVAPGKILLKSGKKIEALVSAHAIAAHFKHFEVIVVLTSE
jgi:hypothetical protein